MKVRSKFIGKTVIISLVTGLIVIVPLKIKEKKLETYNIEAQADFQYKMGILEELKNAKENIEKVYGNEEDIHKIKSELDTVSSNITLGIDENVGQLVSNITKKISELVAANIQELELLFNDINDSIKNSFNEETNQEINNLINEYTGFLNEDDFVQAKGVLLRLESIVNEAKKTYEAQRIKREYEINSNEDPGSRTPYYVNGILLVNKLHGLPDTYAPGENQEARDAFEKMKVDAEKEGIYLYSFSGYRNFWYQNRLYFNYVNSYGQDPTDTFSARPGFSEHQTGLAFDIGGVDRSLWGEEGFKHTSEAQWLKNNAHNYGFILRYPEGKEWKTGYIYESWHYRYVGLEHSKNFANNNLTLEEYLGE